MMMGTGERIPGGDVRRGGDDGNRGWMGWLGLKLKLKLLLSLRGGFSGSTVVVCDVGSNFPLGTLCVDRWAVLGQMAVVPLARKISWIRTALGRVLRSCSM